MATKWNEIYATQEQSNFSFQLLAVVCAFISGQSSGIETTDSLSRCFGLSSQVLVDKNGKEVGLRILPDLTTLTEVCSFDFLKQT